MSFDNSRIIFNSWNDYLGMITLQGRVQLDSDWNDFQGQFLRRIQAGTLDAIGEAVYPAALPNSFMITAALNGTVNQILIGAGRMYIDGLLAENHGPMGAGNTPTSTAQWDPVLAELSNTYPGAPYVGVDYMAQPFYPNPPAVGAGPYLAYLDVWQREVTYLEDPNLVEKAVGVDTTGRLQTVWQVRLLNVSSAATPVTCSTPPASIPGWTAATQSSGAQLTTALVPSTPTGPCVLTPNTGYTGMENQLYRVEIHAAGGFGTATFKWSRDNGSVMTAVTGINNSATNIAGAPTSALTVQSLGRDQVLGFSAGDWIELTDDDLELNGQPGELHLIDSVTPSTNTITLVTPIVTQANFPLTAGLTDPTRHTRITRWDQQGTVYQSDYKTVVATLGQSPYGGDIPITAAGIVIVLENGVTVSFSLNPDLGQFNTGDFWTFAARTADGSVEIITDAPPRGIHHHYAMLSVVSAFPSTPPDCRLPWPPTPSSAASCGCTLILQPGDVTASNTLQQVLDQFMNLSTETVICLQPGAYNLYAPLQLTSAHSNITLCACQAGTAVLQPASGQESLFTNGLVVLDAVNSFTLNGLQLVIPKVQTSVTTFAGLPVSSLSPDVSQGVQSLMVAIGVRPINCGSLTITECVLNVPSNYYYGVTINPSPSPSPSLAIAQQGFQGNIPVVQQGNVTAPAGVNAPANPAPASTAPTLFGAIVFAAGSCSEFVIENNQFDGGGVLAGFLVAPTVSFSATPVAPAPPTNVTALARASAAGRTIRGRATKAVKAAPKLSRMIAEQGPAGVDLPITTKIPIDIGDAGLGTAQPVFDAPSNLTNYAANGGSVLASTLTDSVFKGNSFSNTTFAALVVGGSAGIEFTENEVDSCAGGFVLMSPSMASAAAMDPQKLALTGLTIAMGYPLPVTDSGPSTIMAAPTAIRVLTGAASVTDSSQNTWLPESSVTSLTVSGGALSQPTNPVPPITGALPDQSDAPLYQSERWGVFTYTFAVPVTGFYQVTLKFAEIAFNASGQRVFNVSINGTQVITAFDIFLDSGGEYVADDKVFGNVVPVNGQIVIGFTQGAAQLNWPKISAVAIEPQWDGLIPSPYFSGVNSTSFYNGELTNFYGQLTQLGQQGFASLALSPLRLRLDDNEMTGLTFEGFLVLWDDQVLNGNTSSVVMRGNRLDTTNFTEKYSAFWNAGCSRYFFSAATLALVSRCVVSGNILTNEGAKSNLAVTEDDVFSRLSLVLDTVGNRLQYSPSREGYLVAQLTQHSVGGNVFQGVTNVFPPPSDVLVFRDVNSVIA